MRVRLDRAVASSSWLNMFENAAVDHLASPCSDHCPILLRTSPTVHASVGAKILRYEIMWKREGSLVETVLEIFQLTYIVIFTIKEAFKPSKSD